jgi:hypothetical protein
MSKTTIRLEDFVSLALTDELRPCRICGSERAACPSLEVAWMGENKCPYLEREIRKGGWDEAQQSKRRKS